MSFWFTGTAIVKNPMNMFVFCCKLCSCYDTTSRIPTFALCWLKLCDLYAIKCVHCRNNLHKDVVEIKMFENVKK